MGSLNEQQKRVVQGQGPGTVGRPVRGGPEGRRLTCRCVWFVQQESMPFAVVGSDKEYQVNGKRVLGRKTPWGIIEGNSVHLLEEPAAGGQLR